MKVRVYSAPWCPICKMTKEWLKSHNTEFEDINVQEDIKASLYVFEKTGQTAVPVIEIDGQLIIGFNEETLKEVLRIE
ncbi:MAG: glutaredoxin family protein [Nitrospirota bacterium]